MERRIVTVDLDHRQDRGHWDSAWSNTMLADDSKTSPVTSRPDAMPVCSIISRPTIASIGSAIALIVFTMITTSHFGVRHETGANPIVLAIGVASTVTVLIAFAVTTLVDEPGTAIAPVVILFVSVCAIRSGSGTAKDASPSLRRRARSERRSYCGRNDAIELGCSVDEGRDDPAEQETGAKAGGHRRRVGASGL